MPTYLEAVRNRMGSEDTASLLEELQRAFAEAPNDSPAKRSPRGRELHELVRFSFFDTIAPWLKDEREALLRIVTFARRIGDAEIVRILTAALDGATQPDVEFSLPMPGQAPIPMDADAGEITMYDGKDWGSTDLALGFAMDSFRDVVLHEVVHADELQLTAPAPRVAAANLRR